MPVNRAVVRWSGVTVLCDVGVFLGGEHRLDELSERRDLRLLVAELLGEMLLDKGTRSDAPDESSPQIGASTSCQTLTCPAPSTDSFSLSCSHWIAAAAVGDMCGSNVGVGIIDMSGNAV